MAKSSKGKSQTQRASSGAIPREPSSLSETLENKPVSGDIKSIGSVSGQGAGEGGLQTSMRNFGGDANVQYLDCDGLTGA